tara:strand:+ start:483 stop:689 length:207 start_codon:yes stop_codon:yes gene_type:complete
MFDWLLNWLHINESEGSPLSEGHLRREADAEVLFHQRTVELKLTHEERNRLRNGVSSISQKVKAATND